ncbi:BTB/POZ domain-containing protein [Cladophialophora immunda]|nr:BTB/POZ domain-containing protein [Cladophialophora immunda]
MYSYADIVAVTVGKEKVKYRIYKQILVSKCPFFDKCLGAGMKEAQENAVALPDDDPKAFDVVVRWMYTGRLNGFGTPGFLLLNAYILADKYCIPDLQNAIADVFRAGVFISLGHASWAWGRLPEGSPLRQLFLDQMHYWIASYPDSYRRGSIGTVDASAAALEEIFKGNAGLTTALLWKIIDHSRNSGSCIPTSPASGVSCLYHVHEDGRKCK